MSHEHPFQHFPRSYGLPRLGTRKVTIVEVHEGICPAKTVQVLVTEGEPLTVLGRYSTSRGEHRPLKTADRLDGDALELLRVLLLINAFMKQHHRKSRRRVVVFLPATKGSRFPPQSLFDQ